MQLSKTFTAMTASVPSARFLTGLLGSEVNRREKAKTAVKAK